MPSKNCTKQMADAFHDLVEAVLFLPIWAMAVLGRLRFGIMQLNTHIWSRQPAWPSIRFIPQIISRGYGNISDMVFVAE